MSLMDDLQGVLLARYVALMKWFLYDQNEMNPSPSVTEQTGIRFDPFPEKAIGSYMQRQPQYDTNPCVALYRPLLQKFLEYYIEEEGQLDDTELGLWRTRLEDFAKEVVTSSSEDTSAEGVTER